LRNASGPQPVKTNAGTIRSESRHRRVRPDPVNPSVTSKRARVAILRDALFDAISHPDRAITRQPTATRSRRPRDASDLPDLSNKPDEKTSPATISPTHARRVPLNIIAAVDTAAATVAKRRVRPRAATAKPDASGAVYNKKLLR